MICKATLQNRCVYSSRVDVLFFFESSLAKYFLSLIYGHFTPQIAIVSLVSCRVCWSVQIQNKSTPQNITHYPFFIPSFHPEHGYSFRHEANREVSLPYTDNATSYLRLACTTFTAGFGHHGSRVSVIKVYNTGEAVR